MLHNNPNIPAELTEDEVAQALIAIAARTCFELGLGPSCLARAVNRMRVAGVAEVDQDLLRGRLLTDWLKAKAGR